MDLGSDARRDLGDSKDTVSNILIMRLSVMLIVIIRIVIIVAGAIIMIVIITIIIMNKTITIILIIIKISGFEYTAKGPPSAKRQKHMIINNHTLLYISVYIYVFIYIYIYM